MSQFSRRQVIAVVAVTILLASGVFYIIYQTFPTTRNSPVGSITVTVTHQISSFSPTQFYGIIQTVNRNGSVSLSLYDTTSRIFSCHQNITLTLINPWNKTWISGWGVAFHTVNPSLANHSTSSNQYQVSNATDQPLIAYVLGGHCLA